MGILSNLLKKNYANHLQKYLSTHKINRSSVTWDEVKSIGIIFNGLDSNLNNEILNFIKKSKNQGLNVKALALVDKKTDTSNLIYDTFTSKDISLAKVPNLESLNGFHTTQFDILINFYNEGFMPLEYISIISKAKMRIGLLGTNIECSDLIVGNLESKSFNDLITSSKKIMNRMTVGA